MKFGKGLNFSRRKVGGDVPSALFGGFRWRKSNVESSRPSSTYGTALTPGNNSFPTYVEVLSAAQVTNDVYGILVTIYGTNASGLAKDTLVNIGVDPAGGTNWTTKIPALFASNTPGPSAGPGASYFFPIKIAAGSSIAAQASTNNATVGSARVVIKVFGLPIGSPKVGTTVQAVGANLAASGGAAFTPGGAAEGTWATLGTLDAESWFFQLGVGINNATQTGSVVAVDAAEGDGNTMIVRDAIFINNVSETLTICSPQIDAVQQTISGGSTMKVRGQSSGTPDSGYSAILYAVQGVA